MSKRLPGQPFLSCLKPNAIRLHLADDFQSTMNHGGLVYYDGKIFSVMASRVGVFYAQVDFYSMYLSNPFRSIDAHDPYKMHPVHLNPDVICRLRVEAEFKTVVEEEEGGKQ